MAEEEDNGEAKKYIFCSLEGKELHRDTESKAARDLGDQDMRNGGQRGDMTPKKSTVHMAGTHSHPGLRS